MWAHMLMVTSLDIIISGHTVYTYSKETSLNTELLFMRMLFLHTQGNFIEYCFAIYTYHTQGNFLEYCFAIYAYTVLTYTKKLP